MVGLLGGNSIEGKPSVPPNPPSLIAEMELSLTNGLLTKGEKSFPQGCNMLNKFQDLEEMQSTLKGFCPAPQKDAYVHGKKIYLSKVVNQLLNREYLDDLKRVIERHRPAAVAGAGADAAEAGAAFDPGNLPPYDELRREVLSTWARIYPNHQKEGLPVMLTARGEGGGTSSQTVLFL